MIIKSLGRQTDLIFSRFSGSVIDRGSYTLIQTPSNPDFYWGNYIVFDHAPKKGSLRDWKEIFNQEFSYYSAPHHYVFTWDTGSENKGNVEEFLREGFDMDSAIVLTAKKLHPPPHLNQNIEIRPLTADQDWAQAANLQTICADPRFLNADYAEFKTRQMTDYRKMAKAGMGARFGAFMDDQMVADLGVFHDGKIGRYQNVVTHPDFRRKGICGTLVYRAGMVALKEFGAECLVMEADADYHAARVYESVGFKRHEINYALSWWKQKNTNG